MEVEIKQKDTPEIVEKKLQAFSKKIAEDKKARLGKFFGVLKLTEDPVTLQRKWRDEW